MKKIVIVLMILGIHHINIGQIVDIPDPNFKYVLVNIPCVDTNGDGEMDVDVDTNNDGEIQYYEAESFDNLHLSGYNINSLIGIDAFINLKELYCSGNNLTNLDLSNNLVLEELIAGWNNLTDVNFGANTNLRSFTLINNMITVIDISQNTGLISINLHNNLLSEIDVSQNVNLLGLSIYNNNITSLDLANNPDINQLNCSFNPLMGTLDLSLMNDLYFLICNNTLYSNINTKNGNNLNLTKMWAFDNPNLICLQVDDVVYANNQECDINNWCKDETAVYSEDCLLGFTEQSLQDAIQVYPNPVQDNLHISTPNNIIIKKVSVYDVLGKKVIEILGNQSHINLSRLAKGLLLVKIETNKGLIIKKIIKE